MRMTRLHQLDRPLTEPRTAQLAVLEQTQSLLHGTAVEWGRSME